MKPSTSRFIPLFFAIFLVIGIGIGTFYANHFSGNKLGIINTSSNKLNALLRIIEERYVDTVKIGELVEDAMPQILKELDPHSSYIPASHLEAMNNELKGSFGGVGIQFNLVDDTVRVNKVTKGGPSYRSGIMAGDRIVEVDDTVYVGKNINSELIMKKLKGEIGTKVKIGVVRKGEKGISRYTVIRGNIPVKSVDAAYMIDENFGYICINKFGETTYPELLIALAKLNNEDCKGIIIDLRSNTGGYMEPAIQMVNEFLPKNRLIVYTQGNKVSRENFTSNGTGSNPNIPLVVLVDENSASSSEIFTGAIQDNDRGTIVGRRTFGKGLVQQPIEFSDGSAIRLTIARYYTPSGRCIQKPYQKGKETEYELDIINRFQHGEFFSADSIKQDTAEVYHTRLGRKVYGGGGIMPDIFVPKDTIGYTSYYGQAQQTGLLYQFILEYIDKNREKLNSYNSLEQLQKHLLRQGLVQQFANWADKKGLKRRNNLISKSHKLLEKAALRYIIESVLDAEEMIKYLNQSDSEVQRALEVLRKGESFPKTNPKLPTVSSKKPI